MPYDWLNKAIHDHCPGIVFFNPTAAKVEKCLFAKFTDCRFMRDGHVVIAHLDIGDGVGPADVV
jgi:hypothetical protein